MAITITQEQKKQRYLILVLALMLFAILFVVWRGFLSNKTGFSAEGTLSVTYAVPQVRIDWQLLENIRPETLQPLEEITPFKGKFGRENPFIPY